MLAEVPSEARLGRHLITIVSDGKRSNALPADFITLTPDPLAPSEPGVEETLVVHVDGVGDDPATMSFDIAGPATLLDGGNRATVPVLAGIAQIRLRGTHAGAALVRFKLHVQIK